jgi:hypothetical protein
VSAEASAGGLKHRRGVGGYCRPVEQDAVQVRLRLQNAACRVPLPPPMSPTVRIGEKS